jgi:hypothetical protein
VLWGILAGVLSGVVSGALAAWVTPFAQRRAEEQRAKTEQRRTIIADARQLVADVKVLPADGDEWPGDFVARSSSYLAIHPFLDEEVRILYGDEPTDGRSSWRSGSATHQELRDDISRIEREWNLV